MTKHCINDITLRPFDANKDAESVKVIVGEIWGGGFPALIEKEFGMVGGQPWNNWMSQSILSAFEAKNTKGFVAERDGNVVGFCSYEIETARKCGNIGYNGVAHNYQGLGIGSMMLDFVISQIKAEGMEFALVLVADNEEHIPALRNYEKHGFNRIAGYHHMIVKI